MAGSFQSLSSPDCDPVIRRAVTDFRYAREFEQLFPTSEHAIVPCERELRPRVKVLHEWMSRARLYDRYVITLVVGIRIAADGRVSELELPELYVFELLRLEKGKHEEGGPKYEMNLFKFGEGDWQELLEAKGDFSAFELELTKDSPVERFQTYWEDTR